MVSSPPAPPINEQDLSEKIRYSQKPSLSEYCYLNPAALHRISDINGNCPYTSPAFPHILPDVPLICPENKKWRHGLSWKFMPWVYPMIKNNPDQLSNLHQLLESFENIIEIMQNYAKHYERIFNQTTVRTPKHNVSDFLHIGYQYISCQSEEEIRILLQNMDEIMDDRKYLDIFKEYNYRSWSDIEICFDKVLCMNNVGMGAGYNLYLDCKSQRMMKALINRTEYIEESEFGIDLSFHRNIHQQSFHITIGRVTVTKGDTARFDYVELMDIINDGINLPCIKLGGPPRMSEKSCYAVKELNERRRLQFLKQHCEILE